MIELVEPLLVVDEGLMELLREFELDEGDTVEIWLALDALGLDGVATTGAVSAFESEEIG